MSTYSDIHEWDQAHADFISDEGANADDRLMRRMAAVRRKAAIERRYDHLPGGWRAERARAEEYIKKVVDGMPPLTDEQLCKLALLLSEH